MKKYESKLKKMLAVLTASTTLITITGCSSKTKTNQPTESIPAVSSTTEPETTTSTTITETNTKEPRVEYDGTYTKEMWNIFINNEWEDVTKVIKSSDKDGFTTALYMLNIDTLKENNADLLYDYLKAGRGNNTNDDLNKIFKTLSEVTTNNLTVKTSKDFYSYSEFLANKEDKNYVIKFEEYAKEMIELEAKYNSKTLTDEDCKRAKVIMDEVMAFAKGDSKFNGKALAELSKGAIFACEEVVKVTGTRYRNLRVFNNTTYIDEETYNKFIEGINSTRVLSFIQQDWNYLAGGADMLSPISKEEADAAYNKIISQRNKLYEDGNILGLTTEEVNALYAIVNIDYFVQDSTNKSAFNKIYSNSFDLNMNLYLAESAIKKIADYNETVKNTENLYDYSRFVIDNKEAIITLTGLIPVVHTIYTEETNANSMAQKLIDYAAYSDQAYFKATFDFEDGKGVQTYMLDKNSLTIGANDLVNKIIYYTFIDNQDVISPQLVTDALALTDGTQAISKTQEQISLMLDGVCLEKNEVLDTYEIGHLERIQEYIYTDEKESAKVYAYTYDPYAK